MTRTINKLIIHCSATPNGKHFDAENIDAWHWSRGFHRTREAINRFNPEMPHIGYHHVILLDGVRQLGREEREVGAHAVGENLHSIGVCLIGTDKFTEAQWHTLRVVVKDFYHRWPEGTVHGHREFASKLCPGFDVQTWLRSGMSTPEWHLLEKRNA
jgi:hypothetical protein